MVFLENEAKKSGIALALACFFNDVISGKKPSKE
jgi:hypothetical protein